MLDNGLNGHYGSQDDLFADCELLEKSGLFDSAAYRAASGIEADQHAAEHYLLMGWRRRIEPTNGFDGSFLYPYFRSVGLMGPPAITFISLREAGWPVYPTKASAEALATLIRTSELFDADSYAARLDYRDQLDPALHYVIIGEQMGYAPSERFDPAFYRERYPDVEQASMNLLGHYLTNGRGEGRYPASIASQLTFDLSRVDPQRETILLITHEASRTGAPILAYNVAMRLRQRYNIVALLLTGGELVQDFAACCSAVIGPLTYPNWHEAEAKRIFRRLLASCRISYAIVNSIESRLFIPSLVREQVPVLTLVHEFASYTRPRGAMGEALDWTTQIIFSADVTAKSAVEERPTLSSRKIHILPQGKCDLPPVRDRQALEHGKQKLRAMRTKNGEASLVVLGGGAVQIRKGVDIFVSCAAAVAAMKTKRPVHFVWIGKGFEPESDYVYSCYLAEQIERSGLEGKVTIIDEVADLEPAYQMADIFFLSSRLDPLPNVAIDAALHGMPILCFEGASGIAALLLADAALRGCVVPHLDVHQAACVIAQLANDDHLRIEIGKAIREFAHATFDMDRYIDRLDLLGKEAIGMTRQRGEDFSTLSNDLLFDENVYLLPNVYMTRDEAIQDFLTRWISVGLSRQPTLNPNFRRPCAGFHPQIYAHAHGGAYNASTENPLAHFIRRGKPPGPWYHDVIMPSVTTLPGPRQRRLRTGLHVHFYYPELVRPFLQKLASSASACDLLVSTDEVEKAEVLRRALADYDRGQVLIRTGPNRGRDIGPFLTGFADQIGHYDVIGHLHAKRSLFVADAAMGETWREFLWQNLLGDLYPMMDIILTRFEADEMLGMVFADDPHLSDWDKNFELSADLMKRMGADDALPPFFNFPIGTMFWARTAALRPLFGLKLRWEDYPEEPLPGDGTILHAIERLLPFAARHAGYRFLTTHIPGVTW